MEGAPHKQDSEEPPREKNQEKTWHWWYGHEEHIHRKKKPADKASRASSGSSHEALGHVETAEPETEKTPRERTEPQTRERTLADYSTKEKIEAILEGENSEEGDAAKKSTLKKRLRDIKYLIQGRDYDRVKMKTDQGASTPWRTNVYWNESKKPYQAAWRNLRTWAIDNKIWDKEDEREFIKETGGRKDKWLRDTAQSMGLNIAVGGLYGVGYAIIAPWKAFELGLKFASHMTGDEKYTHGMMEKIFGKEKEKAEKKQKKDEKRNPLQEYNTKIKVKEHEIEYLIGLKTQMTDFDRLKSIKESPEYTAASPEERSQLEKKSEKEYQNAWRKTRLYWIQEQAWTIESEEQFRNEIGESNLDSHSLLTPQEFKKSQKAEERIKKIEKELGVLETKSEKSDDDETKGKNLQEEKEKLKDTIAEISEIKKQRKSSLIWPEYKKGKETEDYILTSGDADTEEE